MLKQKKRYFGNLSMPYYQATACNMRRGLFFLERKGFSASQSINVTMVGKTCVNKKLQISEMLNLVYRILKVCLVDGFCIRIPKLTCSSFQYSIFARFLQISVV